MVPDEGPSQRLVFPAAAGQRRLRNRPAMRWPAVGDSDTTRAKLYPGEVVDSAQIDSGVGLALVGSGQGFIKREPPFCVPAESSYGSTLRRILANPLFYKKVRVAYLAAWITSKSIFVP